VLVEEYIDGRQIAPVSYVDKKGKLHIVAGVDVLRGPDVGQKHIQNVYRTTPSTMSDKQIQKVHTVLQLLVDRTGLKSTFLDPELYWVGNRLYVIEVNVRLGGFRSILLKQAYGIDLDELVVRLAMGEDLSIRFKQRKSCTATEVWDDRTGIIKSFVMPDGYDYVNLTYKSAQGDGYLAPPKGNVPLSYFYIVDTKNSLAVAKKIRAEVDLEIDETQ
jgi:biotin carboxylase